MHEVMDRRIGLGATAVTVFALTALLAAGLWGCESRDSTQAGGDELAIRELVEQGAKDFASRDTKNLLGRTAKGFVAHPGGLSRGQTLRELSRLFRVSGSLDVLHPQPEIEIADDDVSAVVNVPFALVRPGAATASLDDAASDPQAWSRLASQIGTVYSAELSLSFQGGHWLVTSLRIQ